MGLVECEQSGEHSSEQIVTCMMCTYRHDLHVVFTLR